MARPTIPAAPRTRTLKGDSLVVRPAAAQIEEGADVLEIQHEAIVARLVEARPLFAGLDHRAPALRRPGQEIALLLDLGILDVVADLAGELQAPRDDVEAGPESHLVGGRGLQLRVVAREPGEVEECLADVATRRERG